MVIMEVSKKESNNHVKTKDSSNEYGAVILSLKNCLLPDEKLSPTPSFIDGLDADTETDLRILGCDLIQTAGILLRMPQVAMATAQVLFQRFYYSKSFVRQNFEVTGMGCLFLASKIEEAPRRVRDVINVFHHIKQVNSQKTLTSLVLDQNYIALKYQVIKAERRVLKELGFCVHVKHPHKLIVTYLQVLGLENKQALMQTAWNYMNDSLRTDVFVRYQPETVAGACIYLTARKLKFPLPKSPQPWFSLFGLDESDIQDVCLRILKLYSRSKPKAEDLERKIQELSKKFEESRLKNRPGFNNVTSGNNTPNSPAPQEKKSSPKRSHSDRSRTRSGSSSPRQKRYKRSRSKSYDKYKKSRSRRSRTKSPVYKSYKQERRRSRSRSYEKSYKTDKYVADRYKEEKYYDRYRKDDDRYRDDDKYRKDDDKYRSSDDYKYKKDDDYKYKKDDDYKYTKKDDDKYRSSDDYKYNKKEDDYKSKKDDDYKSRKDEDYKYKKDDESRYRKDDDKHRRDDSTSRKKSDDNVKYKKDEDVKRHDEDNGKYKKEDEKERSRKDEDRVAKEESHKHKKEKNSVKDEDGKKVKTKHSSSKHKSTAEKKKKKKQHYESMEEEDDEIKIIHEKRQKKSR